LKCSFKEIRKFQEALAAEFKYASTANHVNVVKVFQMVKYDGKDCMAMELANQGTLDDHVQKKGKYLEAEAKPIFKQVLEGLVYLHDTLKLAHRDIKSTNIMLHDGVAKIVDFGLSCWADERDTPKHNERVGPRFTAAPEWFDKAKPITDPRPGDVYALGITFEEVANMDVVSDEAKQLVAWMKTADPKARPTAKQCLEHAWFKH